MIFPRKLFESAKSDAQQVANRTGKTQYVVSLSWEELYGEVGFTDDEAVANIGTLHATVMPENLNAP